MSVWLTILTWQEDAYLTPTELTLTERDGRELETILSIKEHPNSLTNKSLVLFYCFVAWLSCIFGPLSSLLLSYSSFRFLFIARLDVLDIYC